jgi:hypothetical protein
LKAGIDYKYWTKLHKSLKKLLRNVMRCNDKEMQKHHLGKVYAWFMRKLESSGMINV